MEAQEALSLLHRLPPLMKRLMSAQLTIENRVQGSGSSPSFQHLTHSHEWSLSGLSQTHCVSRYPRGFHPPRGQVPGSGNPSTPRPSCPGSLCRSRLTQPRWYPETS